MSTWKENDYVDDKLPPSREDASSHDDLDIEQEGDSDQVHRDSHDKNGLQLEKTRSVASRKSDIDPFGEPPNGGLNAWLKVLGCFLLYSNIWYACH
jgi:hypothetical protein